jgi:hypothetical protein
MRTRIAIISVLVGLVLLATALGYLLYFGLLTSVGPVKTHSVTYLVPFFGLLWGRLFLAEPIGAGTIAGLGIVLAGVLLVTGVKLPIGRAYRTFTVALTVPWLRGARAMLARRRTTPGASPGPGVRRPHR